jgi:hypothetical protein
MAESRLRRKKRDALAASWLKLTPGERMKRAALMTAAGKRLAAAGRAALDSASIVRDAPKRK